MIDVGIIRGDALQAVPLIIGTDLVYVHTEIEKLLDTEFISGLYQYHEVQYGKDEYILMAMEKNAELNTIIDIILGVN